jgi:hypothetical protein
MNNLTTFRADKDTQYMLVRLQKYWKCNRSDVLRSCVYNLHEAAHTKKKGDDKE